jgi:two-component system sensor histidine kinase KdpD
VSHDLRTPLASIGGAAQVLLDREHPVDEAARRELLETVQEESERLTRLVGNLLDLTRLEAQSFAPVREWVPAEEVLDSALARVRPRLGGRKIATDVSKEVLEVNGDPVLLEQALINLLENAAKHTPAGSPLDLAARLVKAHDAEKDEVVFEVADRGPGLASGDEQRVFEKYYRGVEGRGVHGFGLGLAVVQAIARVHGGWAKAARRAGGGASFSIGIPGARLAGERP